MRPINRGKYASVRSSSSSSNEITEQVRYYLDGHNTDDDEKNTFINDLETLADEEVFDVLFDLPVQEDQDAELMFLALAMGGINESETIEVIEEVADVYLPFASAWAELEDEGLFDQYLKYESEIDEPYRKSVYEWYDETVIDDLDEESSAFEKLHPVLGNIQGELSSEEEAKNKHSRMGIFRSVWNLLNDVLGASVVAVPFYVLNGGFYPGLILLAIYCAIAFGSLMLLHNITIKRGVTSFTEMSYLAFGIPGAIISAIFIFLFNFGGFVGNIILLGQLVDQSLKTFFPVAMAWFHWRYGVIFSVLLLSPLAFFKSLKRFSTVSMLAVSALFFLIGIVIYATFTNEIFPSHLNIDYGDFIRPIPLLQALGGIGYLFTCHDLAFHVVHSLEKPTTVRFGAVALLTMSLTVVIFAGISFCTMLSFGYDKLTPNLLDYYNADEKGFYWIVNIAKIAMILNISISIPYCVYMPRVAILSLIQLKKPYWVLKFPNNSMKRNILHSIVTVLILGGVVALALSGVQLDEVFGLAGGIAGMSISIILPVASWFRVREIDGTEEHFSYCLRTSSGIFFLLLGICTSGTVIYSYFPAE